MSDIIRKERRVAIVMELKNILTKEKVEHIIRKWSQFEHEISSAPRDIEVFRKYITYQNLLSEHLTTTYRDRKTLLGMIDEDLTNLFEMWFHSGLTEDYKIARLYFTFCCSREQQRHNALNALNMLTTQHANEPGSWLCRANYHFKYLHNAEKALETLNEGIKMFKEFDRELFDFALQLEMDISLDNIRKCHGPDKEKKEQLLQDKLLVYIKQMNSYPVTTKENSEAIIHFCIKILREKLDEHKFLQIAQDSIIQMLTDKYKNYSEMWEMLAKRDYDSRVSTSEKLKLCSERYKEGINQLKGQNDCRTLWTAYLSFIKDNAKLLEADVITSAYRDAAEQKILQESDYINWFDISSKKKLKSVYILEEGIHSLKDSKPAVLYRMYMQCLLIRNMEQDSYGVMDSDHDLVIKFHEGCAILGDKALPLWYLMIHLYLTTNNDSKLEDLYKCGVESPVLEIAQSMKLRYFEWVSMTKQFKDICNLYNSLVKKQPYCKELHVAMTRIYAVQGFTPALIKNWRSIYRTMCDQFPNDPDVYKEWAKFYMYEFSGQLSQEDKLKGSLEVHVEAKKNLGIDYSTFIKDMPPLKKMES